MAAGWDPAADQFPWPPMNGTAMSAFTGTDTDLRWDDPSEINTGPATPTTRASASITVVGTPDILRAATGALTVTGSVTVGDTFSIAEYVVTSVAGAPTAADQFDGSSADPAVVGANIATAINDGTIGGWGIVDAVATAGSVALTADAAGSAGNDITLTTDSSLIGLSGTTLTGGADAATLTVGDQVLTASDSRAAGNMDFEVGPSNFDTASSLTDAINDSTNTLGFISASLDGDIVTISAFHDGILGDGIKLETNSNAFTLSDSQTSGGVGTPCPGKSNTIWTILGVNVYRSDTGERGPYFRVNRVPVGTNFFRDRSDRVLVEDEVVKWDTAWIYKGDAPNRNIWRFTTRQTPIVKATGEYVAADSPPDVAVYVDGRLAPIDQVFGPTGEIDLVNVSTWDPSTETWVNPPLPLTDGTSTVKVSYTWGRQELVGGLDKKSKVFYRLTTIAVDPTGESPSGLVETPLGYSAPISPMNSETLDYIWTEAIRRNRWILEQGGERAKLFIRRVSGTPCRCSWDPRLLAYSEQPVNSCLFCFGTGYEGGYEGPTDIIIGPDDAERRVAQTPIGRRLEHAYEVWTGPSPMLSQRDFIVKQNGERYSIGPVRRTAVRGVILQQAFQIGYLSTGDIRYKVPLTGLEELAWPETRYTRPQDVPCETSDPHPVGFDYQATPMGTEVSKIDDAREQRGRTPVWANITYGGKGS